jgi:putative phosphoesterase
MKIAIVSDTHSRNVTTGLALAEVRGRGITTVLHCGDIEGLETVALFRGLAVHFVFGNCDWDREAIRQAVADLGATLHEPFGSLELEGKRIAFVHSDDKALLRELEYSEAFDYLFYGHTHHAEEHRTGPTRVINPGALHRANPKSFLVLDLASDEAETVVVG